MRAMQYITFVFCALISLHLHAGENITKKDILKIIHEVEAAAKSHNVEAIIKHFSTDAKITLNFPAELGGTQVLSVAEYSALLRDGWSLPAEFKYDVKDIQIEISKDQKTATATDIVYESIEIPGQFKIKSKSFEQVKFGLFNGAVLITDLSGKTEIQQ